MTLHQLKNDELHHQLQILVSREREILTEILQHIAEVDRRRLYLQMAYPNLFAYLTECLGYSAGSAQRRIDAARLLQEAPTLPGKLESGELNLAQVSLMQRALRQKKRESRVILTAKSKSELLESLCGQSLDRSSEILSKELDLELKSAPQIQVQKDRSVRLELTLSEVQWQKMQKARELLSNSLPHGSWDQVLESLCDRLIAQKTKLRGDRRDGLKKTTTCDRKLNTPATTYKVPNRVRATLKKAILIRDQCCQWKDPRTGKQCASTWQLQVDHRRPQWTRCLHKAVNLHQAHDLHQDQNLHHAENLQILCGPHNRLKYQQEARIQRKVIRPVGIDPCSG